MNMLKRISTILFVAILLSAGTGISFVYAECGEVLSAGTWKKVKVYHNGIYHAGHVEPDGTWTCNMTPTTFGYEYQCVEFVNRFYWAAGMRGDNWGGDGATYFDQAETFGLTAHEIDGQVPPKANDILCYDNGGHGHVGIVTSVVKTAETTYQVHTVEQNWSDDGVATLDMNYNPTTGNYSIVIRDTYDIEGWLRIPYSGEVYAQDPAEPIQLQQGEERTFVVYYENTMAPPITNKLKNIGALDWKDNSERGDNITGDALVNYSASSPYFHYMELHSCDRAGNPVPSWLYPGDGRWVSNDRIRVTSQDAFNVAPTEKAKFMFTIKVPEDAVPDTYPVYFRPFHATGGYLEDWSKLEDEDKLHFTIIVTNSALYTIGVGEDVSSGITGLFTSKYSGNELLLGELRSPVETARSGFLTDGYYQLFENGSIQVHSGSAFIVSGAIYAEWGDKGYAKWAGFPISDQYSLGGWFPAGF